MNFWRSSLPDTSAHLACDEALFHHVEQTGESWLRVWSPVEPTVVLGYSNSAVKEVNLEFCRQNGIAINRRISGGGTVVLLEGCLCYSLVVPIVTDTPFEHINTTNRFIMETHRCALEESTGQSIKVEGVSDLACNERKFSGNAQKRGRRALLFHGSFLLDADLNLLADCLRHPTSEPDWRTRRTHADFITNLGQPETVIEKAIANAWNARPSEPPKLQSEIARLTADRYGNATWQRCR